MNKNSENNPYTKKVIDDAYKYYRNNFYIITILLACTFFVKQNSFIHYFILIGILYKTIISIIKFYVIKNNYQNAQIKWNFEQTRKKYYYKFNDYNYNDFFKTKQNNIDEVTKSCKLLNINIIQDDVDIIKKKYRKLAMKWHPDKFSNDTVKNKEIAKRNFQKLNNAYEIIKKYKNIK